MTELRIKPLSPEERGEFLRMSATIEGLLRGPDTLWYEIRREHATGVSELADSFVLSLLFPAMRAGASVYVDGMVSVSLLANLERFMDIWALWRPDLYRPIVVRAAQEVEPAPSGSDGAAALFSGGLDSSYMLLRHHRRLVGRRNRRIELGVFVHGADFEPDSLLADWYTPPARRMLDSLGIEMCVVRTNFRQCPAIWEHCHGALLASCLHWFSGRSRYGMIAATVTADFLSHQWGSHPLTDPLLSSARFTIQDDGILVSRVEKADLVRTWPQAMEDLRVCYQLDPDEMNCGTCQKCLFTKLAFMACGPSVPKSLTTDVSWWDVLKLRGLPEWVPYLFLAVLARGKQAGQNGRAWYRAVRVRLWLETYLRPPVRLLRRILNRVRCLARKLTGSGRGNSGET